MWATTEIPTLDRGALDRLAAGEVAAVRIPGFATLDEVGALRDALLSDAIRTSSVPEVARLGISQYQQGLRGSKGEYFAQAAALVEPFDRIFAAADFRPVDRFLDALRALGLDADVMHEPGYGRYWAGTGKLRRGVSPIHVDFAPQDSDGWAVAATCSQLAWNLYLDNPSGGGDLQVWDRQWQPEDDAAHQQTYSYAFHPDVVAGVRRLDVPVTVGDVLLLNSRSYHSVTETTGRVAFGSFISVFDDGRYRLWS